MKEELIKSIRAYLCTDFLKVSGCPSEEASDHSDCINCAKDYIAGYNEAEKASPNSKYKSGNTPQSCANCKVRIENCDLQETCISKGFLYWQHA